jgi:lactoylglutathione lyase
MRIEHVALYGRDLERLVAFYTQYFGADAGTKYVNTGKQFESRFLRFSSGARLEIMSRASVSDGSEKPVGEQLGWAHIAFSVGSIQRVNALSAELQRDGHEIVDGPRWTGDGYYEAVVLDPEGNRVEITE